MHSRDRIQGVLELADSGRSASEVARMTGVPRSTVRAWMAGDVPRHARVRGRAADCQACGAPGRALDDLPAEYVYLLGVYLGDGCISAHPRGVYKLRLFLDGAYPGIVAECVAAVRCVRPHNKVNQLPQRGNFANSAARSTIEVVAYSRSWPCLFPQHGAGPKHTRPIVLAGWQRRLAGRHPERLLRGLIHSDGCRFVNTGTNWRHPRYSFSNRSADIRRIFCEACDAVGVRWTAAPHTVYVSRKADVARLDEFIGPKA